MEPEFWYICPIWFIPSFFLWACLNALCDHFCLSDRISDRYGWRKRTVKKWQEWITGILSLVVTFLIIVEVSILIGFDLMGWKRL